MTLCRSENSVKLSAAPSGSTVVAKNFTLPRSHTVVQPVVQQNSKLKKFHSFSAVVKTPSMVSMSNSLHGEESPQQAAMLPPKLPVQQRVADLSPNPYSGVRCSAQAAVNQCKADWINFENSKNYDGAITAMNHVLYRKDLSHEQVVTLLMRVGESYRQSGKFSDALYLFEKADEIVVSVIFNCKFGFLSKMAALMQRRSDILFQIAAVKLIWSHKPSLGAPTAEAIERSLVQAAAALEDESKISTLSAKRTIEINHNQAFILQNRKCFDEAIQIYSEIIRSREKIGDVDNISYTYHLMAICCQEVGNLPDAIQAINKALNYYRRCSSTDPLHIKEAEIFAAELCGNSNSEVKTDVTQ